MTKEDKGLFDVKLPKGKKLEEATRRLLEDKPKAKTILRRKFNLNKIYGPGNYAGVGEQIEKDGLLKPRMLEIASLVHAAFNSDDKYSDEIKKIMKDGWLWAFTGILYAPHKGAYIQDDPETRNNMPYMKESNLVKKLEENDPTVRFVPFGYKIGNMTPKGLAKNKFVIGLAGKEGATRLAEVAGKYKDKPYLWGFKSVNEPTIRVSAVISYRNLDNRLSVSGDGHCYSRGGCSCGVQKNNN